MENDPNSNAEPIQESLSEIETALKSILADVTDSNRHGEIDFGKAEGAEEL